MRVIVVVSLIFLVSTGGLSSKDKSATVSFHQMAVGMRDAFNCGVVVEKYLRGTLKGKDDEYHQLRQENNCEYVESVLSTIPDKQ
ncbi:MAG TPA: hypothetical protein VH437_00020 [Terriglobales bacterium]